MIDGLSSNELDALPTMVGIVTAARAFGIGRTKAYDMVLKGTFPTEVRKIGHRYRVTKVAILAALNDPVEQA